MGQDENEFANDWSRQTATLKWNQPVTRPLARAGCVSTRLLQARLAYGWPALWIFMATLELGKLAAQLTECEVAEIEFILASLGLRERAELADWLEYTAVMVRMRCHERFSAHQELESCRQQLLSLN